MSTDYTDGGPKGKKTTLYNKQTGKAVTFSSPQAAKSAMGSGLYSTKPAAQPAAKPAATNRGGTGSRPQNRGGARPSTASKPKTEQGGFISMAWNALTSPFTRSIKDAKKANKPTASAKPAPQRSNGQPRKQETQNTPWYADKSWMESYNQFPTALSESTSPRAHTAHPNLGQRAIQRRTDELTGKELKRRSPNGNHQMTPSQEKKYRKEHPNYKKQEKAVQKSFDDIDRNEQDKNYAKAQLKEEEAAQARVDNAMEQLFLTIDKDNTLGDLWAKADEQSRLSFEERLKNRGTLEELAMYEGFGLNGGQVDRLVKDASDALASHYETHDLENLANKYWNRLGATKQNQIINVIINYAKQNQFDGGYDKFLRDQAVVAAKQELKNWDKLSKAQQNEVVNKLIPEVRKQYDGELRKEATKMARNYSNRRVYNFAVQMNAPKDALDGFLRGIENNSVGMGIRTFARTKAGTSGDLAARMEATQRYNKEHGLIGGAGNIAGMVTDPALRGGGALASGTTKVGVGLVGKMLGQGGKAIVSKASQGVLGKMTLGAIQGAVNLGTFETIHATLNQGQFGGVLDYDENGLPVVKEYSGKEIAKSAGHGALAGFATGIFGAGFGHYGNKFVQEATSAGSKTLARTLVTAAGVVGEGTVFLLPDYFDINAEYDKAIAELSNPKSDSYEADEAMRAAKADKLNAQRSETMFESWEDSVAFVLGLKLQHGMKNIPETGGILFGKGRGSFAEKWGRMLDGNKFDLALTDDEKRELDEHGYGSLKEIAIGALEDARRKKSGEESDSEEKNSAEYEKFTQLVEDKNISEAARAKMIFYATGKVPPMSPVLDGYMREVKDENGRTRYVVESVGENGIITSRTFKGKDSAEAELLNVMRSAELNTYALGETNYANNFNTVRFYEACERVAEETGVPLEDVALTYFKGKSELTDADKALNEKVAATVKELGDDFVNSQGYRVRSLDKVREYVSDLWAGTDIEKAINKKPEDRDDLDARALQYYTKILYGVDPEAKDVDVNGGVPPEGGTPPADGGNPPEGGAPAVEGAEEVNPIDAAYQRGLNSDEQGMRDVYLEHTNNPSEETDAAWQGVVDKITEEADNRAALEREAAKQQQHTDGNYYYAELKETDEGGNKKGVFVVDGNVVMLADGKGIDREASDKSVVVFDPATGEKKMIDPSSDMGLSFVGRAETPEQRERNIQFGRDEYMREELDKAQGKLTFEPGEKVTLPTGEQGEIMSARDGRALVVVERNGKEETVEHTFDELQVVRDAELRADYERRHPNNVITQETKQPADAATETEQTVQGVSETMTPEQDAREGERTEPGTERVPSESLEFTEGAPDEFVGGTEIRLRDEEGNVNDAMVMGRVRYENGEFVPDENGRMIEYLENGEVKHLHEDRLRDRVVEHRIAEEADGFDAVGDEAATVSQPTEQAVPAERIERAPAEGTEVLSEGDKARVNDLNAWLQNPAVVSAMREYGKGANSVEDIVQRALADNPSDNVREAFDDILRFESTRRTMEGFLERGDAEAPKSVRSDGEREQQVAQDGEGVSPARQTYNEAVQKFGEKAGKKIDATVASKEKALATAKKNLDKAQDDFDNAPMDNDAKEAAALQKAQAAYEAAKAEKDKWDAVKAEYDNAVAATQPEAGEETAIMTQQSEPMATDAAAQEDLPYHKRPVKDTITKLYSRPEGGKPFTPQQVIDIIDENIKEADKVVKSYAKKSPKRSADPEQYRRNIAEFEAAKADAEARAEYWRKVKAENERVLHLDESTELGTLEEEPFEPTTIEEHVAQAFYGGSRHNAYKITPESYRRETGYGWQEQRMNVGVIAKAENGGMTVEHCAEKIWEDLPETLQSQYDSQDVRNIILDMAQGGNLAGAVKRIIDAGRRRMRDDYESYMENMRHEYYWDKYHMETEDAIAYEEMRIPDIIDKLSGIDRAEYDRKTAEYYEEQDEVRNLAAEKETETKVESNKEGNGNTEEGYESEREGGRSGSGSEVLPGEKPNVGNEGKVGTNVSRENGGIGSRVNTDGDVSERASGGDERVSRTDLSEYNGTEERLAAGQGQEGIVRGGAYAGLPGLVENELSRRLSERQRNLYDALAKTLGIEIEFTDGDYSGVYDNNRVRISLETAKDGRAVLSAVFAHEVTHHLKDHVGEDVWNTLEAAVRRAMGDEAFEASVKDNIEKHNNYIDELRAKGEGNGLSHLTEEGGREETVSYFFQHEALQDEASAVRFLKSLEGDRRTVSQIAKAVRDFLLDLWRKLRGTGNERAVKDALDVWENACKVVGADVRERRAATEAVAEAPNSVRSDVEDGHDVKFSLPERERERDDEYKRLADIVETSANPQEISSAKARMREILDEVKREKGYSDDNDYMDGHHAPGASVDTEDFRNIDTIREEVEGNSSDSNLFAIAQGVSTQPDDYFSPNGARWYMYDDDAGMESYRNLKRAIDDIQSQLSEYGVVREMPVVPVYRAVPNDILGSRFESGGQWVSPSRIYAVNHGEHRFGEGEYRIIEEQVPADELWWDGNDIREWGYDDGRFYAYKNTENNRKSDDLITYDDNGNIILPSQRFNEGKSDVRFSLPNEREDKKPVFYSNAERAVESVQQEKANAGQWLAMIKKQGGLKASEDKWLGLSDWLESHKGESLTKQEVLDYIMENDVQVEEVEYGEYNELEVPEFVKDYQEEYRNYYNEAVQDGKSEEKAEDYAWSKMLENHGDDFALGFTPDGERLSFDSDSPYNTYLAEQFGERLPINSIRLDYTTNGLENKKEIALTVPTIEPYKESDILHFGDADGGRAVAWVRFGETKDADGKRVLVIDEIQSKRHQDGREKGYGKQTEIPYPEKKDVRFENVEFDDGTIARRGVYEVVVNGSIKRFESTVLKENDYVDDDVLININRQVNEDNVETFRSGKNLVPDAPFDKNWHELAMKRMLRYAAENGYDKVAWTTGAQQAERYGLGGVVERIVHYSTDGQNGADERQIGIHMKNGDKMRLVVDTDGKVTSGAGMVAEGTPLSDVVGKELAAKIMNGEGADATMYQNGEDVPAKRIDGDGLRIGGEGMKGFYDMMLPRFMDKYGKKWGVKTGMVELPLVEKSGRTMHAVDVTPEMKESVIQGQPKFSLPDNAKLTKRERELRDGLIEKVSRAVGAEKVITDVETSQRVLDLVNGVVALSRGKKRALETAVPGDGTPFKATVISSADGAKVLQDVGNLAKKSENLTIGQKKSFLKDVAVALGAKRRGSASQYATFETKNGRIVTIRLADHNASTRKFDNAGVDDGISIVISRKPNDGLQNDGNAHIVEFFYPDKKLRKAEDGAYSAIVRSIEQALYSGEYKDATGLAEREEVNANDVARFHLVYHGSGADYDRFDFSYMGTGEGAQSYGHGGYFSEVKGIGMIYAGQGRGKFTFKGLTWEKLWHGEHSPEVMAALDVMERRENYEQYESFEESVQAVRKNAEEAISSFNNAPEYKESIEHYKEKIDALDNMKEDDFKRKEKILYTVEIPEENGRNYLVWERRAGAKLIKKVSKALDDAGIKVTTWTPKNTDGTEVYATTENKLWYLINNAGKINKGQVQDLVEVLGIICGNEKAASDLLHSIGFTGISYPAEYRSGGRADKARNYVIFDENDIQIVDKFKFFRTPNGEAYGFTLNGKIYIDPRIATAETPVHEYHHLWAEALEKSNPDAWAHLKSELYKDADLVSWVKERYPDLAGDENALAHELFAKFGGKRGTERLREEQAKAEAENKDGIVGKARIIAMFNRFKDMLSKYWQMARDLFAGNNTRLNDMSVNDFADMAMADLMKEVKPGDDAATVSQHSETEDVPRDGQLFLFGDDSMESSGRRYSLPERERKDAIDAEMRDIEDKAKAAKTLGKAPNGKTSRLGDRRQWLQVRTEAFKNWFGDWEKDPENASKIVDDNGEPLVVYHASPEYGFTTFKDNAFFSKNREYTDRYEKGGDTYEVYLNIRKPFDIRNPKDRKIFTEYRNGHEPARTKSGAMDWAEFDYYDKENEEGLQQYLMDNYPNEYDGFILDEGADGGYGNDVKARGLSYVPFYPEQIKSATDNIGTFDRSNKDIRFSLPEEDRKVSSAHDAMSRKGLREIVGKEGYDAFLDDVGRRLRDDVKKEVSSSAGRAFLDDILGDGAKGEGGERMSYDERRRAAVGNLLGELADKPFEDFTERDRDLWQKAKAAAREAIEKDGALPKWFELGDNEFRYMLWRGKEGIERDNAHPIDVARDIVKRDELGLGESSARFSLPDVESGESGLPDVESGTAGKSKKSEMEKLWEDGSMSLDERVALAAIRLSDANKADMEKRDDAVQAIGRSLGSINRILSAQRGLDGTTVKRVTDLARVLMNTGHLSDLSNGEVKKLLSAIGKAMSHKSVGKAADYESRDLHEAVQKVMDVMVDNQLKQGRNTLDSLLKIKGSKVDAKGVEVQGKLDPEGQAVLRHFKEAKETLDKNSVRESIADAAERMGSENAVEAADAANEHAALLLAQDFFDNVKEIKRELRELNDKRKEISKNDALSKEERSEALASIDEAIRANKIETAQAYQDITSRLAGTMRESMDKAQAFKEAEKERVKQIQHYANSDMQGKDAGAHRKKGKHKIVNALAGSVLNPLQSFEQYMRMFGSRTADGEGYLFTHFMRGVVDARDKEIEGVRGKYEILDNKVKEIFGKNAKNMGALLSYVSKLKGIEVEFVDGNEKVTRKLGQGNMLYIYMVNKMLDGRMKLRSMGITEEHVEAIKQSLDPRLIEFADWVQDEFLVNCRNEYNETHKRMFGADMAAIDDYFPLKILGDARRVDEELDKQDALEMSVGATVTGAIKKRVRNTTALDIINANALNVLLDHVNEMEHWNAFAEWGRDVNTLLSYNKFKQRVKNMTTVYGAGDNLWNNFKKCCRIAAGTFVHDVSDAEKVYLSVSRGATSACVSFRLNTALKQILSLPAVIPELSLRGMREMIKDPSNPWSWCMNNLPQFKERWFGRMSGDPRLKRTEGGWLDWRENWVQKAARLGMSPNAFVDAVTCSIVAYATYNGRKAQYLKEGYDAERADKMAKQDATMSFNLSQQSSEGAYLSPIQAQKDYISTLFTIFRNASMSYTRQTFDSARGLTRALNPNQRKIMVETMAKKYMRDGIDEAQAYKNAKNKLNRQMRKDFIRFAVFGVGLPMLWTMGGYWLYGVFGSDDDKKKELWDDVVAHTITSPFQGLTGGDVAENIVASIIGGKFDENKLTKDMPISSTFAKIGKNFKKGENLDAINDMINLFIMSGIGVNPQTVEDVVVGVADLIEHSGGDLELANESLLLWAYIANCPKSQIDQLYIDQIDMSGKEARKLSPSQVAERYASKQVKLGRPLMPWLWDDEKLLEKGREKFDKNAAERIAIYSDDKLKDMMNSNDEVSKKYASKEASKRLGVEDYFSKSNAAAYNKEYVKHRDYVDLAEDAVLQNAKKDAKEKGNDDLYKEVDSVQRELTKMRKELIEEGVNASDVMRDIRAYRREKMNELGL